MEPGHAERRVSSTPSPDSKSRLGGPNSGGSADGEVRDTTAGQRRGKERFGAGHRNAETKPGYNNATSVELLSRRGQEVAELASIEPTDRVGRDAREPGRRLPQEETEERPVRPETP